LINAEVLLINAEVLLINAEVVLINLGKLSVVALRSGRGRTGSPGQRT
jgi:hypothetical protein